MTILQLMPPKETQPEPKLHRRNRHRGGYDFKQLATVYPPLNDLILNSPDGKPTIDYANAEAVKALNKEMLIDRYKLDFWDIPDG